MHAWFGVPGSLCFSWMMKILQEWNTKCLTRTKQNLMRFAICTKKRFRETNIAFLRMH